MRFVPPQGALDDTRPLGTWYVMNGRGRNRDLVRHTTQISYVLYVKADALKGLPDPETNGFGVYGVTFPFVEHCCSYGVVTGLEGPEIFRQGFS